MDQNLPRKPRGRARNSQPYQFRGNQTSYSNTNTPQINYFPRQPPQMSRMSNQIGALLHHSPRLESVNHQNSGSTKSVERMPKGINLLSTRTFGQVMDLVINYFPIKSYTNFTLYQYRIDFSPKEETIKSKRALLRNHRDKFGGYLFDGTILFSSKMCDSKEFTLLSKHTSDDQIVTIKVTFISALGPNDYAFIPVFNCLMRHCMNKLNLNFVAQNFYDSVAKVTIPEHKVQLWLDYKTSLEMFNYSLLLRADVTTKVMRGNTVLNFYYDCMKSNQVNFIDSFKAGVIKSIVWTPYNNRTYIVYDVDDSPVHNATFKMKDGTKISYIDYYKKKWNITIREGYQPLLMSKTKKVSKLFIPNDEDIIYLVPEICILTGIFTSMRNSYHLTKELAKHPCINPIERIKKYNNFMNRLQSTPESVQSLNKWNLSLSNDLLRIKGRVLSQQKLYSHKAYESRNNVNWTKHVRSLPIYTSALIQRWVIVYPNQNENDIREFLNRIQQVGKDLSFKIPQPVFYPITTLHSSDYVFFLERIVNEFNPSCILCVIQSQRGDVYSLIKRFLCITRAVPSQVVLLKNVLNQNMSLCTKIAIQINYKLGGAPWKVSIPTPGIMIVGFDVCHDKKHKSRSFGALIASLNDDHTKYYSNVHPHYNGEELSHHFAIYVAGALDAYKKFNKKLPAMIIIYRNGVEDGMDSFVQKIEVKSVKEVCENFYGKGSEPPLAFIIVKKRISLRFFNAKESLVSNTSSGTVVDTLITDPTMYDFYLVSQNMSFAAVKPTHYNVIMDTLPEWSPNKMQLLTYKLTRLYYNRMGTVQIPVHCLLAHKLALFVSQTLRVTPNVALNENLYFL